MRKEFRRKAFENANTLISSISFVVVNSFPVVKIGKPYFTVESYLPTVVGGNDILINIKLRNYSSLVAIDIMLIADSP